MNKNFMYKRDTQLKDFFLNKHGIDVSCYEETFLQNLLDKRIKVTNCNSVNGYIHFLQVHPEESMDFLQLLQNSYSAFFRNSLTFAVIDHLLLPSIINRKTESKEIRIWSAACAAGQEPYSLAMLLEEHIIPEKKNFSYRIFATDRVAKQIELAQTGSYHADLISNLNLMYLNKWFTQTGNYYVVKPELKKNIEFSVFDLFDENNISPPESIYGDFDLVICANILFYYEPSYQKIIIDKLRNSLADDGLLITGEAEREILKAGNFKEVYPQSGIFKKK